MKTHFHVADAFSRKMLGILVFSTKKKQHCVSIFFIHFLRFYCNSLLRMSRERFIQIKLMMHKYNVYIADILYCLSAVCSLPSTPSSLSTQQRVFYISLAVIALVCSNIVLGCLSIHPCVFPLREKVISRVCLEGISSNLQLMSTWHQGLIQKLGLAKYIFKQDFHVGLRT